MTVKVDKRSRWHDPSFEPNEGPVASDEFAPIDSRGVPLRGWIEQELQVRSATRTGGTETIIRGKAYLRQMDWGEFELSIFRGRSTYDTFYSYDRNELVQYVLSLLERK